LPSIHADERARMVRRNTVLLACAQGLAGMNFPVLLGFNDLVVSLSSAFAGLTSAFIFEGAGFRVLGLGVAVVVLAVMVSVLRVRQPAAPLAVQR
jgi:uncharacterized membrane protein YczE